MEHFCPARARTLTSPAQNFQRLHHQRILTDSNLSPLKWEPIAAKFKNHFPKISEFPLLN